MQCSIKASHWNPLGQHKHLPTFCSWLSNCVKIKILSYPMVYNAEKIGLVIWMPRICWECCVRSMQAPETNWASTNTCQLFAAGYQTVLKLKFWAILYCIMLRKLVWWFECPELVENAVFDPGKPLKPTGPAQTPANFLQLVIKLCQNWNSELSYSV
jgi:hypothetical protein